MKMAKEEDDLRKNRHEGGTSGHLKWQIGFITGQKGGVDQNYDSTRKSIKQTADIDLEIVARKWER